MTKMSLDYDGDLHCKIVHESSGQLLMTDAPVDHMGKGESFSPTDLLAASLASCIATTIGIFAKKKGWELSGMRLEIEKEMKNSPYRCIARLPLKIWMPLLLTSEEQEIVKRVALTCPVHKSLIPEIEIPITFYWQ